MSLPNRSASGAQCRRARSGAAARLGAALRMPLAGLLLLATACGSAAPVRPSLVLVVLDTVRADALSCYGAAPGTTPVIDSLAEQGLRFERASSTSPWTVPSHASLFTGVHSARHGATQEQPRLGEGLETLAQILRAQGYATLGVSANPLVSSVTGLSRGFEHFEDAWRPGAPDAIAHVRRFVAGLPAERPYFLFVNWMEAHEPYAPPPALVARHAGGSADSGALARALGRSVADFYLGRMPDDELRALRRLYAAAVAHADLRVGETLDALRDAGRLDGALVVVTSDHGESFGEHDHFRHVFHLEESVVRVPLVISGAGTSAGVRSEAVSGVDVFATLAAAAGAVLPPGRTPGRDLRAASAAALPVFAEYYTPLQALGNLPAGALAGHPAVFAAFRRRLRSVEAEGHRLVESTAGPPTLRRVGPAGELSEDLAAVAAAAPLRERLAAELAGFVAANGGERPLPGGAPREPSFGTLDADTEARLRTLGYLAE